MADRHDNPFQPGKEKHKETGVFDSHRSTGWFNKGQFNLSFWFFWISLIAVVLLNALITAPADTPVEYSRFKQLIESGDIRRVEFGDGYLIGFSRTREEIVQRQAQVHRYRTVPVSDPSLVPLLERHGVEYYAPVIRGRQLLSFLTNWVLPILLISLIWRAMFKRMGHLGPDVMSFGKNRSRIVAEGETGVRFHDVAGVDEATAELEEIVDFLKHPERCTAVGGKIPKGVLLVGPLATREYSEATQQYVDEQTAKIVNQRCDRVLALLDGK